MNKIAQPLSKLNYRSEIDGLRALAVISVIFYHAQFVFFGRVWFTGGFIGVDIFFVLSGYLISRIFFLELYKTDSFDFLNFYERRSRRILPMLFFVIVISYPFAWLILSPFEFIEYAESIIASILFGSNFFFYLNTTDYGSSSALLKPFLHTWSLGVEEQFYLIFPFIGILAYRYCKNCMLIILISLSVISLLFAEFTQTANPDLSFYLPFSRFWELFCGALLATRELKQNNSTKLAHHKYLSAFGLFLVIFSVFFFNSETPHPGFYTLIPVVGVMLLISYTSKEDWVGKFLSTKPFIWIGLVSYSAYLWHFPLFALVRSANIDLTNSHKIILILITLLLSFLSYRIIEKPFRNKDIVSSKKLFSVVGISSVVIILTCLVTIKTDGFALRFGKLETLSNEIVYYRKQYWEDYSPFYNREQDKLISFPDVNVNEKNVLVIGNSWAHDIAVALSKLENIKVQFESKTGHMCNELTLPIVKKGQKSYQQWFERCRSNALRFSQIPANTNIVVLSDNIFSKGQYKNQRTQKEFEKNLKTLRENFHGRILVIKGRPTWKEGVFKKIIQLDELNVDYNYALQNELNQSIDEMLSVEKYYEEYYSNYDDVEFLSLVKSFCDTEICQLLGDGNLFYFDSQHLNLHGVKKILPELKRKIR